ncbi:hypothetical protein PF007_g15662 [Phytophthora fragariae]|uniref:Uncharacterized protein n=1 Tax=Phytophthora fragariae TaxID=53985 RepID=A0A6A3RLY6_9STRA|nr:hypothetical protein PF003_g28509 [Phytophthora fragariae]KAE9100048.1 hypothetical protein PF007_g15662 [Phytophthora fragariae]KAE9134700.1 hypothetical protein PF006_g14755 [Phytophthora fragariae]KAE9299787.1 hypothetical protein PF001_g15270 [Phytophthora fragariae]
MKALPLSFCEDPHTRACTKLPRVSRHTLKVHMFAIMKNVEAFIRAHLPHAFGLVFDGWTTSGVRYVGLFAVFPPTDAIPAGRVLLAFPPLEDESDLGAQSLSNFLADTLSEFDRPWSRGPVFSSLSETTVLSINTLVIEVAFRSADVPVTATTWRFNCS